MREIPPKDYHLHIPHDAEDDSAIEQTEKDIAFFEKQIISIHHIMISKGYLPSLDAIRRAAEEVDGLFDAGQLPADFPQFLQGRLPEYGERRVLAVEEVFREMDFVNAEALQKAPEEIETSPSERDVLSPVYTPEVDAATYPGPSYVVGDRVQVAAEVKPGHIRVPAYLLGKPGKISQFQGMFLNPEEVAHFRRTVVRLPLYLVEFDFVDVWEDACPERCIYDKLRAEIYEPWLFQPS